MAKRWVAAGHKVEVITGVPNVPSGIIYKGYKNRLRQIEFIDGIRVTRVWTYIAANRGKIKRVINYLSYMASAVVAGLFVRKPDVVIATSPQFFCGWAGVFLARIRRVPFVLEIRDIWPSSIVAVGAMRQGHMVRVLQFLERKMYAMADHIVTLGEGYKQALLCRSVPAVKISVISNGVDPELFSPRRPHPLLRHEQGLDGQFICSYVGTVGMACGLGVVLRTAQLLNDMDRRDISFLIVGDGAARSTLQNQAKHMRLENVFFIGLQPKAVIPDYLSISNACLVHLRKNEVFRQVMPSKIFEAAGMAKPIILGIRGFVEQFILDAGAGLVIEPESERELADAVIRLADNPGLCSMYGEAGYRYVREAYSRDKLATDYLDVIDSFLRGCVKSSQ